MCATSSSLLHLDQAMSWISKSLIQQSVSELLWALTVQTSWASTPLRVLDHHYSYHGVSLSILANGSVFRMTFNQSSGTVDVLNQQQSLNYSILNDFSVVPQSLC